MAAITLTPSIPLTAARQEEATHPSLEMGLKAVIFQAASYLTYPACTCDEFYTRLFVLDAMNPTASKVELWAQVFFLCLGIALLGLVALVTAPLGIALRYLASLIEKESFLYLRGDAADKVLQNKQFSLLSWNICCVGGGYAITDGGVFPWGFRIEALAKKIEEEDADVVCLYELFDAAAAFELYETQKKKYAHFYFNIAPREMGACSGIFVASKFAIKNPEFVAFSKDDLVGRTKNCNKGVFGFDLDSQGTHFARIHATHLQHSEECDAPTPEELSSRRKTMTIVAEKANAVAGKCSLVTGDLNLDDPEYQQSSWSQRFDKGRLLFDPEKEKTWPGDEFCAKLVAKKISPGLNLDHTMIVKGTAKSLSTSLVKTGYDPKVFTKNALSDHAGLLSLVTLQ